MTSKEQTQSTDKAGAKQKTPTPAVDGQTRQDSPLEGLVQRARSDPRLLTPKDVLQLQRISGNQAVTQLLSGAAPRPNQTGLPDQLKTGVENLSGFSLDEVKVHYNSEKPVQLNALAYAQGNEIHLAPGQEKHLPHETWHVIQQAQGRVQPTIQLKEGIPVNDDKGLEHEADVMGAKALANATQLQPPLANTSYHPQQIAGNVAGRAFLSGPVQRKLPAGLAPKTKVVKHEEGGDASGYEIKRSIMGNYKITTTDGDIEQKGTISTGNTEWGTEEGKVESRQVWEEQRAKIAAGAEAEKLRKELIVGENYLSADYRRINPLLAAFEKNGYVSSQVRDKEFDYSAKKANILADMKIIAVARKYADEGGAAAWTEEDVDAIYKMLRTILDVWEKFPKPVGPSKETIARVFRGDTIHIYDSFPKLNPALLENGLKEGLNDVNVDVSMPGILSTTYGDPKTHNYVKGKTIVWDITVPEKSEGKGLGTNNQSEQEMSFPIGTVLHVKQILVRQVEQTAEADVYGTIAKVVLKATI